MSRTDLSGRSSGQEPVACTKDVVLFIQECAMKLEATELTVATACVLYHKYARFAAAKNLSDLLAETRRSWRLPKTDVFDPEDEVEEEEEKRTGSSVGMVQDRYMIATSCLLLAGKIEENHLNIRKLINVAYKTFFKEKELTQIDQFYAMRETVITLELWLLRVVGFQFDAHAQHPHKYLVCFLKVMQDWLPRDTFVKHPVVAVCWAMLRDSYLTDIILDEKPEHIAVCVMACALQLFRISVPGQDLATRSWIRAFCNDLSGQRLENIVTRLLDVYKERRS